VRIAHVLTYVSADGAYGGPLAVMVAQCRELAARGHHVEVFAGWDGVATLEIPGVTVHLFRVFRAVPMGFSGLVSPALFRELTGRARQFDVLHVHLSRDLIAAPTVLATLLRGRSPRVYLQTHGMVKPDARPKARVFDLAIRPILRRSTSVLALTTADADRVAAVAKGGVSIVELPNGVPAQEHGRTGTEDGAGVPEVLFLARLQPRKRVQLFAEAAALLLAEGLKARFAVVGPDEGDLAELRRFVDSRGLADSIVYEGAIPPGTAPDRLRSADVYVLPSLNEPFPMTVLEAMSVGVPTVISATCLIADRLREHEAVVLFDGGAAELAEAIRGLLVDPVARRALGERARTVAERYFTAGAVVDLLEHYYSMGRDQLRTDERQLARNGVGER
jgi:glycosyltransferase involved in cell wall biosynthesis